MDRDVWNKAQSALSLPDKLERSVRGGKTNIGILLSRTKRFRLEFLMSITFQRNNWATEWAENVRESRMKV